jgi:hypothetical protein
MRGFTLLFEFFSLISILSIFSCAYVFAQRALERPVPLRGPVKPIAVQCFLFTFTFSQSLYCTFNWVRIERRRGVVTSGDHGRSYNVFS